MLPEGPNPSLPRLIRTDVPCQMETGGPGANSNIGSASEH